MYKSQVYFQIKNMVNLLKKKPKSIIQNSGQCIRQWDVSFRFYRHISRLQIQCYDPHEPKRNGFDYWDENPEFYKDLVFRLVLQNDVVQNKDNRCILYKIWSIETNSAKNLKRVSIRESWFFLKEKIWFVWFIGGYKNSWKWSAYFIKKRHQNNRESTK